MASQIGLLFQDQNFGVPYKGNTVGKANAVKAQKKGGVLGGRKPLSEISNSAKMASTTQASKKHDPKSLVYIKDVADGESNRKSTAAKTSDKVQTRSRKALSDISNSGKTHPRETSKSKQSMKLSVVEEEHLFPSCILGEGFLHDHRKCIEAHNRQMGVEEFLATVGLTNVPSKQIKSPLPFKSSKTKAENDKPCDLELEEISEYLMEEESLWEEKKLNSPLCGTPKSPNFSRSSAWEDCGSINFKLVDSP